MNKTNNKIFYCCGDSFVGSHDKGKPPHCPICGKYPKGYKRGTLKVRKRNLYYVPVALRVKIK